MKGNEKILRWDSQSLYDAIWHKDIDPSLVAFEYFGVKFPYSRLYSEIERAAKAFREAGIRKGDIVSLMLPTLPETLYSIYALNRIGAVPNMIDIRSTPEQLKKCLERTHSKVLLIMTFYLKEVETVRKDLDVNRIILLRGCDSMPSFVLFWYKFGELFNGRRFVARRSGKYLFWDKFIQSGAGYSGVIDDARPSGDMAMIFQTSGTTGNSKSVVHSSFAINNSTDWVYRVQNGPRVGDRVLCILPAFAFFGFVTNIHLALMNRMTAIIIPLFDYHKFGQIIVKHRPNYTFGIPSHWEHVVKLGTSIGDLSFIKDVSVAGEVAEPDLKKSVNDFLKQNGSSAEVSVAYGMTETGGCVSLINSRLSQSDIYDRGNVGKPMPYVSVIIIDPEDGSELPAGRMGEVCLQTELAFKEYYDDPQATEQLVRMHPDGKKWMHTGDLGYLSPEGELYVVGRSKRMIVRFDGTKLFPVEIEDVIKKCPGVSECVVVAANDPEHIQAQTPFAFVVPGSDSLTEDALWRFIGAQLPVHMKPAGIKFLESIPLTGVGKPDIVTLSKMIG